MKLRELKKELGRPGWFFQRQGKHEVWTNGTETVAVPRHKEIDEFTAKSILRTAAKFSGKKEKQ